MTAVSGVETEFPRPPVTQWNSLIGHDRLTRWIGSAVRSGRIGGSLLLVGPAGVGKRTIARLLAETLLCERSLPAQMEPCGQCEACIQVQAGTHPDLIRVGKPIDKSYIPLELLIGPPEARMQAGFCRDIRLRPMTGKRKIAILEDADFLNEEGANCLLKTLEEPPSGAVVLLIGESEQRQLPTIRSRCQILRVGPLNVADATNLLREVHGVDASESRFIEAIEISGGDMQVAARLLTHATDDFRVSLSDLLLAEYPNPIGLARLINSQVDLAGKDPSKRRASMRDIFSIAVQHFRSQMRNEAFQNLTETTTQNRLDRSIRALREIDRNANQSTLIECFAADIAMAVTGDRGEIG